MDTPDMPLLPALPAAPTPVAATVWQDEPDLFALLRNRLASYAPNSQRALAADWRSWRAWCSGNARTPFPATPRDIVDFVHAHSPRLDADASGAVSMSRDDSGPAIRRATTVQRWLASLSTLHRIAEAADPTRAEDVKAARRTITRGRALPEQKAPLRWTDVEKALNTLGYDMRDLRAKALIAVAYSTLARRAELIDLHVEDITFNADDDGTVTLRTKGGAVHERYLAPEARMALANWLDKAGIDTGAVFRRIERQGCVGERTITSAEVARTFKRIAVLIGFDLTSVARISAHSTRIGAAQDLTAAGAALPEIMVAGGWKSPQMPAHYARKLDARQGAMRRWLDAARKPAAP